MESVITMVKMVNVASTLKCVHALWEICPSLLSLSKSPGSHWWSRHHCGLVPTSCIFMLVERIVWPLSHSINLWSIYTCYDCTVSRHTYVKSSRKPYTDSGFLALQRWNLGYCPISLGSSIVGVRCHVWHGYNDRRWEAGKERGRMEKKGNPTTEWLLSDWVACLFL